ncbi:phage major capsid protein, P2 family [Yersinia enterocolitica]|uniref:phage major capsid protein, P2 family n=1 Tax=Yersinia enterocolitica TaxID=630 RepID=UPI0005E310E6|nr:phage major capsid protein, P2 family [Yersinia enterocolitica]EKN3331164.1 phage major capsid protein, P2 family [Yersinia enterocolitica]EKN3764915.1 phage major capsid protein, P2 family [Yersinia enterocolitica]EKN4029674.1 phage major capsid protein, P2 family [Yersinia enterocolitica]ELI8059859.1 phage major capsid protein, P2 family [Yersinia enterocolitica]CNJ62369.1 major capsid protein [Yersinia enterocolitica]
MRPATRFKFNAYLTRQAELNGVETGDLNKKFSVEPSVTQTIMTRVQESSEFLSSINIVPVAELTAEKVGLGVNGSVASTTDTDGGDERETAEFASLDSEKYFCEQVNYDFHIRYNTLDLWARYQDFQTRLRDAIIKRQALDRIMAGFNGTHRAKTSNRAQNPLLQDIAVGWLQKYRTNAPARVMDSFTAKDGTVTDKITVGDEGNYVNLDALVMDAASSMIAEWYQEDPELVVITGRQLMQDKYFPLVNKVQENSETLAADLIISQKRIGNLPAVRAPYFPPNAFMITRLDNLSIYWLEDSHRRHIDENAKRDRIENYESIKQDYVVEDYACGCLVENIEILPAKKDIASAPAAAALMVSEAPNYDGLAAAIMAAVNVAANPNEVKPEATAATESTPETPATKGSK